MRLKHIIIFIILGVIGYFVDKLTVVFFIFILYLFRHYIKWKRIQKPIACFVILFFLYLLGYIPSNFQLEHIIKASSGIQMGSMTVLQLEKSYYPWVRKLCQNIKYDLIIKYKRPFIDIYPMDYKLVSWNHSDATYHGLFNILIKNLGWQKVTIDSIKWEFEPKDKITPAASYYIRRLKENKAAKEKFNIEKSKEIQDHELKLRKAEKRKNKKKISKFTKKIAEIKNIEKEQTNIFNEEITKYQFYLDEIEGKGKSLERGEEKLFSYAPETKTKMKEKGRFKLIITIRYHLNNDENNKCESRFEGAIEYDPSKFFVSKGYRFRNCEVYYKKSM